MKKILILLLATATTLHADEWMPFSTKTGKAKVSSSGTGTLTKPYDFSDISLTGLVGVGTVTNFSAGDLSPLFTTSEATTTTTPALSFSLSNAAAHSYFGNNTGSTGAPGFNQIDYSELTGAPPPTLTGSYMISGGGVGYTGTGLDFIVSAATYVINGTQYSIATDTPLTLDPADLSDDRIDVFAVDDTGAAVVITGIPGGPPLEPSVDPTSQLRLTSVTVLANSSTPEITTVDLYHENTEWTSSTSGGSIVLASTNNPHAGTKDIEGTSVAAGTFFGLQKPSGTVALSDYDSLIFYIRSKAAWPSAKAISIFWRNSTTNVGSTVALKNGTFGFDSSNTTTYQQIVIPLSAFGTGTSAVDNVRFGVTGGGSSIGWYIDDIVLQGGGGGGTGSTGDVSSDTNVSVNNEVAVFHGTTGKLIGRATGTGIPKLTSGVLGIATPGTDYLTTSSISDTAYDAATWDGVTTIAPSKNAVRDKIESLAGTIPTISDTAFASSWDTVTTIAPSKNAIYDWAHTFDTDDDGLPNKVDTTTDGFVKTTSSNGTISIDTNTYLTSSSISDTAFGSGWNTVTTVAPSKNAVYDELHIGDTDDDGKIDVLDVVASAGFLAVTSGGVPVEGRTLTEGLAIDITNPTGAAGAPTFAFDPTELTGSRTWGDASTDTIVWTFDRATGTDSTITSLSGGIGVQSLTDAALTSGRVTFAGASGILTDDADLTFATDTLTATNAKVTTPTNTTTSVVTIDGTQTLTNKRVNPRALDSNAPASPVAPDSDSYDFVDYRGINAALTINAPTGTPVSGQKLIIRFKDDGTARALTWQTGSSGQFRASSDLALPTTTVLSKTLYCGFIWNATDSRWDLLAKLDNF